MTPERWRRVEELYDAALAQPITNRAAFLAQAVAATKTCAPKSKCCWRKGHRH
jgi:hypothetical protein